MRTLYAAYGSNLNISQMHRRCPTATVYGTAWLRDYELVFRGTRSHAVATVEPKEGGAVPIGLWHITPQDEAALDRCEGWPHLYEKKQMAFRDGGSTISAMIYVMTPGHILGLPFANYFQTIRQGYADFKLEPALLDAALERCQAQLSKEAPHLFEIGPDPFGQPLFPGW